jgi:hypothetical protein
MLGTLVIIGWAVLWCVPIFGVLKWLGVLRIPADMERTGVDVAKHNESAYPSSAWLQQKQQEHKEWMAHQQPYLHFGQTKSIEISESIKIHLINCTTNQIHCLSRNRTSWIGITLRRSVHSQ